MEKLVIPISTNSECQISIVHYPDDPARWEVHQFRKQFLWNKKVHTRWFNTREQAEVYAKKLAEEWRRSRRLTQV